MCFKELNVRSDTFGYIDDIESDCLALTIAICPDHQPVDVTTVQFYVLNDMK
jgi:hypothetical protein